MISRIDYGSNNDIKSGKSGSKGINVTISFFNHGFV
jgi:hypothetical protein